MKGSQARPAEDRTATKRLKQAEREKEVQNMGGCCLAVLIQEKSLFTTICPKYVRDAAEILEEMLAE